MSDMKDLISRALLSGALNSVASLLIFQGNFQVPDSFILAASGSVGQLASDVTHDMLYKSIPNSEKFKQTGTSLISLASYNLAQLPLLYLGKCQCPILRNIPC